LGNLTRKIVPEMTDYVPSGTLNPTVPYRTSENDIYNKIQESMGMAMNVLLFWSWLTFSMYRVVIDFWSCSVVSW